MKRGIRFFVLALLAFVPSVWAQTPETLTQPVLTPELLGANTTPKKMMFQWMLSQVNAAEQKWRDDYEKIKTPEQIAAYQKRLKEMFIQQVGGFPERTPLNAKITGVIDSKEIGIKREKVLFESMPGQYVTGILYLPNEAKYPKPWPGVLMVCGHSLNGKAYVNYQRAAVLHALNGMATLMIDPIDQGERFQLIDREAKKSLAASVHAHNLIGIGSILLGRNTARFEIWDMMRGLDYLETRDDVKKGALGVAGLSGGGTQTAYIMALDDRVSVAASCCYLCSLFGMLKNCSPQDAEQNIFGQCAFGMDHADYCMMRAPKPTLIGSATKDFFPIDMTWDSFRYAKRFFQRMGYGENMDLAETDNTHGYDKTLREATVRFMLRFLAKREEAIFEPETVLELPDKEIRVTPEGFTMLLPGAKSTYDYNREYAAELTQKRAENPITKENVSQIREIAKIRPTAEIPQAKVVFQSKPEAFGENVTLEKLVFQTDAKILLPAFRFVPKDAKETVLYVNSNGKAAAYEEDILPLLQAGKSVLAVDLRGWGETQAGTGNYFKPDCFGIDGQDFYIGYNLGCTHVGWRTEDILSVARWAGKVELVAVSEGCIPALHAAVLEPEFFTGTTLKACPESWTAVVEKGGFSTMPLTSVVHGALRVYDLPDLRKLLK
ncbi:MAG: hypothetical protein Q4D98_05985 [Planctomycetia bacterium]|nr:hypothetical protein [Planctomycetia bacterium]